jgi:hypothetical protein
MPTEQPKSMASVAVMPLEPFALSPKETAIYENCGVSVVYERLARGEYEALKTARARRLCWNRSSAAAPACRKRNFSRCDRASPGVPARHPATPAGIPSHPKS